MRKTIQIEFEKKVDDICRKGTNGGCFTGGRKDTKEASRRSFTHVERREKAAGDQEPRGRSLLSSRSTTDEVPLHNTIDVHANTQSTIDGNAQLYTATGRETGCAR